MTNATKGKNPSTTQAKVSMAALWKESMADEDFRFDIQAQSVAVDLVRAISKFGLTQSQIAERLGWKPSRVSRVLHGSSNVTLRTLHDFAIALGLEFDVIYRHAGQRRAPQPWETQAMLDDALSVCRQIDTLHDNAQANLNRSEVILDTACQLVRRGWNAAKLNLPTKPAKLPEAA